MGFAELSDEMLDNVIGGVGDAAMNRLDFTSHGLSTASENVQSAESTFSAADEAKEMAEFAKNNILLQTAQAMLDQANQTEQGVMSLLQ